MLGINAHINRDLPHAVIEAGVNVNCAGCYQDYVRIDDVLRLNMPLVRRRIADAYGAELPVSQRWLGHFAGSRIHRRFKHARRNSWEFATLLARADTKTARRRVYNLIEERAENAGRKILLSATGVGHIASTAGTAAYNHYVRYFGDRRRHARGPVFFDR